MPLSPQVLFANLNISDYMKFDIFKKKKQTP